METLLQDEVKKAMTDQALHAVYDDAVKQMPAARRRCTRATSCSASPTRNDDEGSKAAEDKVKAVIARLKKGEDFAKLANELDRGPVGPQGRRRSRLLHQGADGAGVRRGRLHARQGQDLRSGEDPVRLARHQGRGQAQARSRRRSTRSRASSRASSRARRRSISSPSCAPTPRSSALDKPAGAAARSAGRSRRRTPKQGDLTPCAATDSIRP